MTRFGAIIKETFSDWLQSRLQRRGVKPGQLAAFLGVDHVSVANWLQGKYRPQSTNAIKIAQYCKVDPDYVLVLTGHRPAHLDKDLSLLSPRLKLYLARIAHLSEADQEMIANVIGPIVEREEQVAEPRRRKALPSEQD